MASKRRQRTNNFGATAEETCANKKHHFSMEEAEREAFNTSCGVGRQFYAYKCPAKGCDYYCVGTRLGTKNEYVDYRSKRRW